MTARYLLNPVYVGLVDGYVGLFQINITVPVMPAQTQVYQGTADANATIQEPGAANGSVLICVMP